MARRKQAVAPLEAPGGARKILLHTCCAPCSGDVTRSLVDAGFDVTVIFYNPNIHPRAEYELRKAENKRFADELNVPFVDLDYDPDRWFERCEHLAWEPEKGERCTACFDMRLERSALYAHENGFPVLASTLATSRFKSVEQVNGCGERAAARYADVRYWSHDWRKGGGSNRMDAISKEKAFYRQEYCGCVYSLRDNNAHRERQGRRPVRIRGELPHRYRDLAEERPED